MEWDPSSVVKAVSLSNDTEARKIKEIALNSEEQLRATLRHHPFSIQLDGTTAANNNALLMA